MAEKDDSFYQSVLVSSCCHNRTRFCLALPCGVDLLRFLHPLFVTDFWCTQCLVVQIPSSEYSVKYVQMNKGFISDDIYCKIKTMIKANLIM